MQTVHQCASCNGWIALAANGDAIQLLMQFAFDETDKGSILFDDNDTGCGACRLIGDGVGRDAVRQDVQRLNELW